MTTKNSYKLSIYYFHLTHSWKRLKRKIFKIQGLKNKFKLKRQKNNSQIEGLKQQSSLFFFLKATCVRILGLDIISPYEIQLLR